MLCIPDIPIPTWRYMYQQMYLGKMRLSWPMEKMQVCSKCFCYAQPLFHFKVHTIHVHVFIGVKLPNALLSTSSPILHFPF